MRLSMPIVVALFCLLGHGVAGQTRSPEAQLKAAQHKAQVEGDLNGAIEQYKQLAVRRGVQRDVTAEALLGLAQAYEKLGTAEARKVYEQIIRDYTDQRTIAAVARERVAALGTSDARGYVARQLLQLPNEIAVLTLLSDGRIGGTDWETGDVVIADPSSGAISHVVKGDIYGPNSPFGETPLLSPDGEQLAYTWFGADASEKRGALRILPTARNATPRTLLADPGHVTNITSIGWSSDSKSILICYEKPQSADSSAPQGRGDFELAWVAIDGGTTKPFKTFEWWRSGVGAPNSIGKVSLSPDGRSIAYAVPERQGPPDRSIFVMNADGSGVRRVVSGGVNDFPIWTADGARLLFLSNRSGDSALWSIAVDGRGDATPTVVKNGMARVFLHGILPSGKLVYEEMDLDPLVIAELEPSAESKAARQVRVIETLHGEAPAWSPDGRYLAYKRRTTNPGRPVEMVVRTSESGESRSYAPVAATMGTGRPTWYGDGTVQALRRSGIRLNVAGSALEEIQVPRTLPMGFVSPDGRTLYADAGETGVEVFDVTSGTGKGTIPLPQSWRFAALSPSGEQLALVRFDSSNKQGRLGLIGVDGRGFRELPTSITGATPGSVRWTRDGSALFVELETRKNMSSIQRVPIDGGAPVTIASDLGELLSFDISPDERRIAYSINSPTTNVWMLDLKAALK